MVVVYETQCHPDAAELHDNFKTQGRKDERTKKASFYGVAIYIQEQWRETLAHSHAGLAKAACMKPPVGEMCVSNPAVTAYQAIFCTACPSARFGPQTMQAARQRFAGPCSSAPS